MIVKPQGIVKNLLNRTQFSIRDINQGAHYGIFKGVGPTWLYGEVHAKRVAGAGIGARKALGVNQTGWIGGYVYLPFEGKQSLSTDNLMVGIEGGSRSLQVSLNFSTVWPGLQLTSPYLEFQLLGFGV